MSNPPPGTAQFGRVKSDSLRPFLAKACDQASEGEAPEAINLEASDSTWDAELPDAPLPDAAVLFDALLAAALELEDAQEGGS
jgi:hypothetical protein